MEKDIENFFEWCEDREKSTAILCRMSDDEVRETELYDEYRSHLMLLKNYFRIAGDEYVDPEYRDLNSRLLDDPFKTTGYDGFDKYKNTLLDDLFFYAFILLIFVFFPLVVSGNI